MSFACWVAVKGTPNDDYTLPYTAQAPISGERFFETEDDVWDEVEKIVKVTTNRNKKQGKDRSVGQELYFTISRQPFGIKYILETWMFDVIKEYHYVKDYNIPVSKDLDSADAFRLDCFDIIQSEFMAIGKVKDGS